MSSRPRPGECVQLRKMGNTSEAIERIEVKNAAP